MRIDLRGNIKSAGPVFLTFAKGVQGRSLLRRTVAVEDDAPWRRGKGVGVLLVPGVVFTVGSWHPDEDPNLEVEARSAAEQSERIVDWKTITVLGDHLPDEEPEEWTIIPMEQSA